MRDFPEELLRGYRGFRGAKFPRHRERYESLASKGQFPATLVIACCDSRAAPETVFGSGPGQMFVVRNVANIVPPCQPDDGHHSTSAALEFAVQCLDVKNIVVMGHCSCGGIAAALKSNHTPLSPGNFIGQWIEILRPIICEVVDDTTVATKSRQLVAERKSVLQSLKNLRSFPFVKAREALGELRLFGTWFDIGAGQLWVADEHSGRFSPLDLALPHAESADGEAVRHVIEISRTFAI